MNVKIDTKEKFTVITPIEAEIPANMTEELNELLMAHQSKAVPHLVLNMEQVKFLDRNVGRRLADIQQNFYEKDISFVVCSLQEEPEKMLEEEELLEIMNITPSESEAWDIVQMEEIERELLNDDFESDQSN